MSLTIGLLMHCLWFPETRKSGLGSYSYDKVVCHRI